MLAGSATIFFSSIKVWINERTTTATEQGLITDRINKAVEGLGAEKVAVRQARTIEVRIDNHGSSETRLQMLGAEYPVESHETVTEKGKWEKVERNEPNIEVRIGSILALERLATQNLDFHIQIMEILCAYVRQNAPIAHEAVRRVPDAVPEARLDIQSAIKVIGRRRNENKRLETENRFRLDLRFCDLSGIDFATRDYSGAMMQGCILHWCNFRRSNLDGAELFGAKMSYCRFHSASLIGTRLDGVEITEPSDIGTPVINDLGWARTKGTIIVGADLSAVFYLGKLKNYIGNIPMDGSDRTILHQRYQRGVDKAQKKFHRSFENEGLDADDIWHAYYQDLREQGFGNWLEFNTSDGTTEYDIQTKLSELGLSAFPFHGS